MCNHLYFQRNASDFVDAVSGAFIRQSDALAHIDFSRVCAVRACESICVHRSNEHGGSDE